MVGVELVHLDRIVALLHEHGCSAGGACGREPPCGKAYGAEIRAHSVPVRYACPSVMRSRQKESPTETQRMYRANIACPCRISTGTFQLQISTCQISTRDCVASPVDIVCRITIRAGLP